MATPFKGFLGRHFRCVAITLLILVLGLSLVGSALLGFEIQPPKAFRPHRPPPALPRQNHVPHPAGPSDPYAEKVFLMLKTGAKASWARLPVHFEVTFPRWPHYAVYGDVDMVVMGEHIIGLFDGMPKDILESDSMAEFRVLKQMEREHWRWSPNDVKTDNGWTTDKFKNIPMLAHAWRAAPENTEWFFFLDDDTYAFQDNILQWLKTLDSNDAYYFGSMAPTVVHEDGETKPISFAHGGSGVIISRGSMQRLFGPLEPQAEADARINALLDASAHDAVNDCCGDAVVAQELWKHANVAYDTIFKEAPTGFGPFQANALPAQRLSKDNWCLPVFTWHGISSQEMEELHSYEIKRLRHSRRLPEEEEVNRERKILYGDLYRDMVMGHIVEKQEDWFIAQPNLLLNAEEVAGNAEVIELIKASQKPLEPHNKFMDCEDFCKVHDRCLAWSFSPGECRIFDGYFSLGTAYNHYEKKYDPAKKSVSGWMVDRIREIRNNASCDPLKITDGEANDRSEFFEGWLVREIEN